MTITNDERREVAARLRRIAKGGAPEWATTACCIAELLGEDDYPLWSGSEKLFAILADLIEPEPLNCETCSQMDNRDSFIFHLLQAERYEQTCQIDRRVPDAPFCLKCAQDWNDDWNYCPNCGCKVIN